MKKVQTKVPAPGHGEHQLPAINVHTVAVAAANAAAAVPPLTEPKLGSLPNTPPVQRINPDKGKKGDTHSLERSHSDSSSSKKTRKGKGSDDDEEKAKKRGRKDKKKKKKERKRRREEEENGSTSSDEESDSSESSRGAQGVPLKKKHEKKKREISAEYDLSGDPVLEVALF